MSCNKTGGRRTTRRHRGGNAHSGSMVGNHTSSSGPNHTSSSGPNHPGMMIARNKTSGNYKGTQSAGRKRRRKSMGGSRKSHKRRMGGLSFKNLFGGMKWL